MSEKKQPVDLGLLEEDDEFEEFPAEDWAGLDEDEDAHVWEDNWDDDNVEDDFSNQLRVIYLQQVEVQRRPAMFPLFYHQPILSSTPEQKTKMIHMNKLWP
ncbi:26S proteasome complex subunit SEM1 isoform X1 [Delphinapterus leucas]|uniref:26S proteasome complex subunit SEM1 n=1 Tax=Delphinapterus leucas TaxID=9749 RepID=A0A2Y9P8B1_DELLE|nr:26S proteasome complex subunit SEM1 isoform X1 [Delphinapterus leucas]